MTGYISREFRHDCRDKGCYISQLPSWDDIIAVLPRKIRPTDIDGMVEINGHMLILEEKRPGVGLQEGQRKALIELAKHTGITSVFFRPGVRVEMEMLVIGDPWHPPNGWEPTTRDEFLDYVRAWALAADAEPPEPCHANHRKPMRGVA